MFNWFKKKQEPVVNFETENFETVFETFQTDPLSEVQTKPPTKPTNRRNSKDSKRRKNPGAALR